MDPLIKSQLLYQLSYAPKSLMPQGDLPGFAPPDLGRNENGTYLYGMQRVPSIVPTVNRRFSVSSEDSEHVYSDDRGYLRQLDSDDYAIIPRDDRQRSRGLYLIAGCLLATLVIVITYTLRYGR